MTVSFKYILVYNCSMYHMVFLGALISIFFNVPYAIGTLKGKVHPNRVSWFLWTVVPLIAFSASISQTGWNWGEFPVLTTLILTGLIFLSSIISKKSYWSVSRIDIYCGFFSVLAIVLWIFTHDANLALILSLLADFFAFIPTIIKAWNHPETEGLGPYLGGVLNALTSFFAFSVWNFASLAFPIYLLVVNSILTVVILKKLN